MSNRSKMAGSEDWSTAAGLNVAIVGVHRRLLQRSGIPYDLNSRSNYSDMSDDNGTVFRGLELGASLSEACKWANFTMSLAADGIMRNSSISLKHWWTRGFPRLCNNKCHEMCNVGCKGNVSSTTGSRAPIFRIVSLRLPDVLFIVAR